MDGRESTYEPGTTGDLLVSEPGATLIANGRIATTGSFPGQSGWKFFTVEANGTDLRNASVNVGAPAWSPDGIRLAVSKDGRIQVMNQDGSELTPLTAGPNDADPAWSRDGSVVAFSRNGAVWMVETRFGAEAMLIGNGRDPTWSPDGSQVAFVRPGSCCNEDSIWVVNADGSDARSVTGPAAFTDWPDWSPDGRWIVFSKSGGGGQNLFRVEVATGSIQQLTSSSTLSHAWPSWSPDGSRIAFIGSQLEGGDYRQDLFTMNAAGGSRARLTTGFFLNYASWGPRPGFVPISDGLSATVGRFEDSVTLSWESNPIWAQAYRLYRATGEGPFSLLGEAAPGETYEDRAVPSCSILAAGTPLRYRVDEVRGTKSAVLGHAAVDPCPRTRLMQTLNTRDAFYWGPLREDNTDGEPDHPPDSLREVFNAEQSGLFPVWIIDSPGSITCCSPLMYDENLLLPDSSEWTFPIESILASFMGPPFDQVVVPLSNLATLEMKSHGHRGLDMPFLDEGLGRAAVRSYLGGKLAFDGGLPIVPGGELDIRSEGLLFLDQEETVREILDGIQLDFALQGPGIRIDLAIPRGLRVPVPMLNKEVHLDVNANLHYELGVDVTGAVAERLAAGNHLGSKLRAMGLGIEGEGEATISGEGRLKALSVSFAESQSRQASIRAEVVAPLRGPLSEEETFRSAYTGVAYRGIRSPTVSLVLGPFDVDPGQVAAELCWNEHCFSGEIAFPQVSAYKVIVLGETEVVSTPPGARVVPATSQGTAALGEMAGVAEHSRLSGDVLQVEVPGPPNGSATLTLSRPMVHRSSTGDFEVAPWTITLEDVAIGPEGTTNLLVDLGAIASTIEGLTSTGLSRASAELVANREVDSDGNGLADLPSGSVGFDPRVATHVELAVPLDAQRRLAVGEALPLLARVEDAQGFPVVTGRVRFFHGEALLGEANLGSQGLASLDAVLSPVSGDSLHAIYLGQPDLRGASTTVHTVTFDPPPRLEMLTPGELDVIREPTLLHLTVGSSRDIVGSSAEYRLDGGDWMPLGMTGTGGFEGTLPLFRDGPHEIEARVSDLAGNHGTDRWTVIADSAPPTLHFKPVNLLGPPYLVGVPWRASEPVLGRMHLVSLEGVTVATTRIESFDVSGTLQFERAPRGVYTLVSEVIDTAGQAVIDPEVRPLVIVT